jgi:hypothetical protein
MESTQYLKAILSAIELAYSIPQFKLGYQLRNRAHYFLLLTKTLDIDPKDPNLNVFDVLQIANKQKFSRVAQVILGDIDKTKRLAQITEELLLDRGIQGKLDSNLRKLLQRLPSVVDETWLGVIKLDTSDFNLNKFFSRIPFVFHPFLIFLENQPEVNADVFVAAIADAPNMNVIERWSHASGFPTIHENYGLCKNFAEELSFTTFRFGYSKIFPKVFATLNTEFTEHYTLNEQECAALIPAILDEDFHQSNVRGIWVRFVQPCKLFQTTENSNDLRQMYAQIWKTVCKRLNEVSK